MVNLPRQPRSKGEGQHFAARFSATLAINFPTPLMLCGPPNGLTNPQASLNSNIGVTLGNINSIFEGARTLRGGFS